MPRSPDPFDDDPLPDAPLDWADAPVAKPADDPFEGVDDEAGTLDFEGVSTRRDPASVDSVSDEGGEDDPFEVVAPPLEGGIPPRRSPRRPSTPASRASAASGLYEASLEAAAKARRDPRPILPSTTTAIIDGVQISAMLAPSMPTSIWRGAPPGSDGQLQTIQLGPLTLQAVLDCRPGAPLLVLGRDVLAGRVLVEA